MAAPVMAASVDGGHGKIEPQRLASRAPAIGRNKSASKTVHKSSGIALRNSGMGRTKAREITPSLSQNNSRMIRRASFSGHVDRTLIDDGTLWREHGNLATWQQTGMASWYGGKRWQGHATTSGAVYDENSLTAAHATLPLGTKVRVVAHNGARSVVVTINDRPGTRSRIIDLSREAARQLGILDAGVAMVTLQPQ